MNKFKVESLIGIGLLTVAILGFILTFVLSLPKGDVVTGRAQSLPKVPTNLFASDNELTQKVQSLIAPPGVPVTPDPANLGRGNVFENF